MNDKKIKLQITSIAFLSVNLFQMSLCPVFLGVVHLFSVNPTAFERMGGEPPNVTMVYENYWALIFLIAPATLAILSIILMAINCNAIVRIIVSVVITLFFLWITIFTIQAAAIPLLQLSSAAKPA